MKKFFTPLVLFMLTALPVIAQDAAMTPTEIVTPVYMDETPSLTSMRMIAPQPRDRSWKNGVVPNMDGSARDKNKTPFDENLITDDPALQLIDGPIELDAPILNFDGINNLQGVYPPDTNGDVGPNHYVQSVNSSFAIWNKSGSLLFGPADLSVLWADIPGPWAGRNDGDPVILYDQLADRWLISQFSLPTFPNGPFYELIAISTTGDPTGSYYRYIYSFANMPDYPKFGVWPDGYYMSVNYFASGSTTYAGAGASIFERDSMLVGRPARLINFTFGSSGLEYSILPGDADGNILPPAGSPNYFFWHVDGTYYGGLDRLMYRSCTVNWITPLSSTMSAQVNLNVNAFDERMCNNSRNCIPQFGTTRGLDAFSGGLMHRTQYRNFGTYQTMVACHTIDVGSDRAGIRWYELRNTGSGWSVYQQGTFSPGTEHRWMGSIAMDGNGNIALGYSISSTAMYPSLRYTGRAFSDPLGTMTVAEQTIINGTGNQTGTASRWGDYSMMSIDPVDDATFWYTNEYIQTSGIANWRTRIASFQLATLNLNTPDGGERWAYNTLNTVLWSSFGINNLRLELSTNNGSTWSNVTGSTSATAGTFGFIAPDIPVETARIRISDVINNLMTDQSSNSFFMPTATFTTTPATGNSSTNFPGTGITFSGNVTSAASINVSYYRANNTSGLLPSGVAVASQYYWIISGSQMLFSNGKVSVPLAFLIGISNPNNLVWLKRETKGAPWQDIGGFINGSNLESDVPFSTFSEFAIGSSSGSDPLPVELSSLNALAKGRTIVLQWSTQSEINSFSFDVERLSGSENWVSVSKIPAGGNSNSPLNYSFTDKELNPGKYSYRLKMIDADGQFEYSQTVEAEILVPDEFALKQNYPNPFNPTTKISFNLPEESEVQLSVYNALGQKVIDLVNQQYPAGFYETDFNGSNLTSGIYFFTLNAQGLEGGTSYTQTRKMLLLK
ncbi:MAG: T9SS type A sorting domain-containing protein [Ignavibacteriales bacterium]|nr:MAG: T9SS type A sorting domain-containing protein [Ignavibacteriales bacterium]